MDMMSEGKGLRSLPFLIIESKDGLILKRGTSELLVRGDTALETLLLILSRCSEAAATAEELCNQFAGPFRSEVSRLIDELCEKRYLVPEELFIQGEGDSETNEDVFYWQYGADPHKITDILSSLQLTIAGINSLSLFICRRLTAMGVSNVLLVDDPLLRNPAYLTNNGKMKTGHIDAGISVLSRSQFEKKGSTTQCIIATSEFGAQACLLPWNELAVLRSVMFLPVLLQDMLGYVGPLVVPRETACLQCLRMRQNAHLHNAEFEREKEEHLLRGASIAAIHPSMLTVIAETAVFELCHFFGRLPGSFPGRLIRIDMPGGSTESKRVLKIPRCPVCSDLNARSPIQVTKLSPMPD